MTGRTSGLNLASQADRLVVEGMRRWMAGYATGEIGCWEMAWSLFERELGPARARRPVSELSCFARAVHTHGARRFCLFPYDCPKTCQDECLLVGVVAAAQSGRSAEAADLCAAIVSREGAGETMYAAAEFARSLTECDLTLTDIDLSALAPEGCPLIQAGATPCH